MDYKHIDELLQKYWNAETSLEEEQQLKTFFATEPVPEQFKETATLFRYFETQKNVGLPDVHFDKELKKKLHHLEWLPLARTSRCETQSWSDRVEKWHAR